MRILILFFSVLAFLFSCEEKEISHHPNIVIILADDMGYGDVEVYNPNSKIPQT